VDGGEQAMFSGIIDHVGRVERVVADGSSHRLIIATRFADLVDGESVAVNGACLTVTRQQTIGSPEFFVSSETLQRTNLSALESGCEVNLERAVTPSTFLSGHIVQGHVDGTATMFAAAREGEGRRLQLRLQNSLHPYCVEKGSIALNGVSLTLNAVGSPGPDGQFGIEITLIPHTLSHTNLRQCLPGTVLNVEVDVLAKYVERLCTIYPKPSNA
jgi:riboflavin synthase